MKADIWMPLYIADYLADTAYLTTEQSGAYLHLLMAYWRNGPPPDNDAILASITKLAPDAWSNARASLVGYFQVVDGRWRNKRADAELSEAQDNRKRNHDRASKAATARWEKQQGMLGALPVALPGGVLDQCPSPSPSPSTKQVCSNEQTATVVQRTQDEGSEPKPDKRQTSKRPWVNVTPDQMAATCPGLTTETAGEYLGYRKQKKAPLTPRAWGTIAEQVALVTWMTPDKTLSEAMARGWCGFKADWLKDNNHPPNGGGKPPARKHDLSTMDYKKGVTDDGKF